MSSSALSSQLRRDEKPATHLQENHASLSHKPEQRQSLPLPVLTCLVPSGSAQQQALQQQALHQAALHHHSLIHHNDLHCPQPLDGVLHSSASHSSLGTQNGVAKVELMEADSPCACSVPLPDAANVPCDVEEGKSISNLVQFEDSYPRLITSQHVDVADCKAAGKHMVMSPVDKSPHNIKCGSSILEDPIQDVMQIKDANLQKGGSIGSRNWSRVGDLRPKCKGVEPCIDSEVDLGGFVIREENIKGFKAGLIHVAQKMPKNAHAHFVLGLMYQRLEQPAKAASAFQKAAEILKKSEEEFGQSRPQLQSLVQCHYAMTMLQARIVSNVYLGTTLQSSEAEGWVEDLKLAVQTDPCYSLVWNTLGLIFFQIGQTEIALSIFRSLLYAVPNCLDALANLGAVYLHRGHLANAARCLQSLLEKDNAYPGALLNYATFLLHQYGSFVAGTGASALREVAAGTAQKCLVAALNLSPRAGHLWASLAAACFLLCDFSHAAKCLEQVLLLIILPSIIHSSFYGSQT